LGHAFAYLEAYLLVAWGKLRTELLLVVQAFAEGRLQIVEDTRVHAEASPSHWGSTQLQEAYCKAKPFDEEEDAAAVLLAADLAGLQFAALSVVDVHQEELAKHLLLAASELPHRRYCYQDQYHQVHFH
jgi:hypothetical protein